jgi:hypothetical protein
MAYYLNVINYAPISDSDGRDNKYERMLAGKKTLPSGRSRHRWQDNIKTDVKKIRCEGFDWIHLAQDRDINSGILYIKSQASGMHKRRKTFDRLKHCKNFKTEFLLVN